MPVRGSSIYRLSRRLDLVKRRLRRWHGREVGDLRQRVESVEADINHLQAKEDRDGGLSTSDLQSLRQGLALHHSLLSQQEIFWRQRSRIQWLQEGDRNTRFFHQATLARRAANRIRRISNEEGHIFEDDDAVREHITRFFQTRWSEQVGGGSPCTPVSQSAKVTDADNSHLTADVSAEEIRSAIWALGPDKAPGPDGFPPLFFRHYWDIVGQDVILAIQTVFSSRSMPREWQRTFIALIPKRLDALLPQHYRPISLCTTLYKACARLLVTRMQGIIPRLISSEQGAFIRGRSITDNILIAQEFMFDLQRATGRHRLMAVKLDMERAYDRISWSFLRQTLRDFGFADIFIEWIMACVQRPTFSILINGSPTGFFSSDMGLRQGCPLSPFLFILCADDLSRSLAQAVEERQLQAYMPGSEGPPLSHLLFADDCILLSPATIQNARACSSILQTYCQASGQLINVQKSILCFSPSTSQRHRATISQIFGISTTADHMSYLGIPITGRSPRQQDFRTLEHRITERLNRWQVSGLSMMGRVTLLRSILTSLPMYILTNALIPVTCIRRIERQFRAFLWGSAQGGRGLHLLSWEMVCLPIREGGLGIQSLVIRRQALIARHATRFLLEPHSFWSSVMRGRYGGWTFETVPRIPRGCSFMWKAICQAAPSIMSDIHCMIGDGRSINITHDTWLADLPLARWPTFISSDMDPLMSVAALISQDSKNWHVPTVSRLFGAELAQRILATPIVSSAVSDTRLWRGSCLPHAPTQDLIDCIRLRSVGLDDVAWIWRLPCHPRIQLFLWKLRWDRLPTCSLLAGRGFNISPLCPICGIQEETIEHALFICPRVSQIWSQLRCSPRISEDGSGCRVFLQAIHTAVLRDRCSQGVHLAYLAHQIWLSRNQQVFAEGTASTQTIIRTASFHATEFSCSGLKSHSGRPGIWDSPAASAANRSTVFIAWEPPPPGYVKVNFDGSVSGRIAGSGFIIRGPEGELLAAGGHGSLDISVPMAELQAAWAGISYAVRILRSRCVIIEGDSTTVIRWIRRASAFCPPHNPLISDIWDTLQLCYDPVIRHVYREANAAADWVAAAAAHCPGHWEWHPGDPYPIVLEQILYSDSSGVTHPRVV